MTESAQLWIGDATPAPARDVPPRAARPARTPRAPDLAEVSGWLLRRWAWLLVATLLGGLAGYLFTRSVTPRFTATTDLVVAPSNLRVVTNDLYAQNLQSDAQIGVLLAVALGLIAATVLPVTLRIHGLANLPVQYLGLHLAWLFVGLLLRLGMVERRRGAMGAVLLLVLAQGGAVLLVADYSLARADLFVIDGRIPVMSAYALAVATFWIAVRARRPRSMLLARIGLISYAMYLLHGSVNVAIYRLMPLTGSMPDALTMAICTLSTLGVSWAVYMRIERPIIRLGRRLSRGSADRIPRTDVVATGGSNT
ncbi:Wzz/FepE/Etk N-terminal domain-containing protein [Methylobacterium sp. HMF5984]|uniref:acyltransferase family protein n=1 Tax=Methylobacterium sp. HMF5984 TaxID=3367370 RepID=UPI003853FF4A